MNAGQPTSAYTKPIQTFLCGLLFIFGLWKPFEKPRWYQILYSTYSVVMLTIFSLIYTVLMVVNIFNMTESATISERLFMSLTEAALAVKIINFFFSNRDWQLILTELNNFEIESAKDDKIIYSSVRIFLIAMRTYFCNVQMAFHASGIVPLIGGAKELLFSGWYPGFDWKNDRRDYWTIYTYQYVGVFITGNLNIAIDLYYCFLLHILSAQYKIVGHRMKSIRTTDESKKTIVNVRLDLIRQMQAHQRLNSTLELIQRNLQWAYFGQMLLSSITICSIIKEIAEVNQTAYNWPEHGKFNILVYFRHLFSMTERHSSEMSFIFRRSQCKYS